MTFLLDTHLLLWVTRDSERLTPQIWSLLGSHTTKLMFSSISIWEIVIKNALGRKDFQVEPRRLRDELIQRGYGELTVRSEHAFAVGGLPSIHKDPFDRVLIAQAQVENITLLTADHQVARYPGPIQAV